MALIVQKYGGTSVGTTERIRSVAGRIAKFKAAGHQLVVVVSAMSGETDRLISLAKEVQPDPDPREFDVELARVGIRLDLLGERDEPVGFSTHCRNHDNELMSCGLELGDAPRDAPDPLGGAGRSPTVFLNDQRHSAL